MPADIKREIAEISKLMYSRGLISGREGNVSVRWGNVVYITPGGVCKGFLSEDMIVTVDLEGNKLEGKYNPSSELKLHLGIYRDRPDLNSVVHTHSPFATAFAVANKPLETKAYPEALCVYGRIPLACYGTPSTNEVYEGVREYIFDFDVILLANHGLVAAGKDIHDAFYKADSAESLARILTVANSLGGAKELSDSKIKELRGL